MIIAIYEDITISIFQIVSCKVMADLHTNKSLLKETFCPKGGSV